MYILWVGIKKSFGDLSITNSCTHTQPWNLSIIMEFSAVSRGEVERKTCKSSFLWCWSRKSKAKGSSVVRVACVRYIYHTFFLLAHKETLMMSSSVWRRVHFKYFPFATFTNILSINLRLKITHKIFVVVDKICFFMVNVHTHTSELLQRTKYRSFIVKMRKLFIYNFFIFSPLNHTLNVHTNSYNLQA